MLEDEQCDFLLRQLVDAGQYEKACCLALAFYSGRRKSELVRFKVGYFKDENIIYGSLYKTPDGAYVSVWRQWFGCVWGAKHYKLAD